MGVVNFKISKIEGERKEKKVSNVTANANSMITSMKLEKDKSIGDYLLVSFKYTVKYQPEIGYINLEGSLWFLDKDLLKLVEDKGKDQVEVKRGVMEEVSTAIIREGLLDSVELSRKLKLPPPMHLPKVELKPRGKNAKAA